MENNWQEKIDELIENSKCNTDHWADQEFSEERLKYFINDIMNQVFEATKKECLDKLEISYFETEEGESNFGETLLETSSGDIVCIYINENSIKNIFKPKL